MTVWGTRGVGGPHDGAGLQVEGNDAAAVVGSRLGVVVSGANLEHLPLLINGRRTPHARSRGSNQLRVHTVLACGLRLTGNHERLPDWFARFRVPGYDTAAE